MKLAVLQVGLTLAAGIAGFRLVPDSHTYASGGFYPSPAGGLIGAVGGMPLLIVVSAAAAGACVALVDGRRRRLVFMGAAGPWLLFPGVDALGLILVGLMRRRARGGRWWALAAVSHAIAALTTLPALLGRRRAVAWAAAIALAVMVGFTIDGELRDVVGDVGPIEHLAWTTRYLLPALYLAVLR